MEFFLIVNLVFISRFFLKFTIFKKRKTPECPEIKPGTCQSPTARTNQTILVQTSQRRHRKHTGTLAKVF